MGLIDLYSQLGVFLHYIYILQMPIELVENSKSINNNVKNVTTTH